MWSFCSSEICDNLQKDDEEWCYFMRYGKPRKNHTLLLRPPLRPTASAAHPPIEEEASRPAAARMTQPNNYTKMCQCINATLSLASLAFFVTILLVLFFIFHNVDNKPWTSIFRSHQDAVAALATTSNVTFDERPEKGRWELRWRSNSEKFRICTFQF